MNSSSSPSSSSAFSPLVSVAFVLFYFGFHRAIFIPLVFLTYDFFKQPSGRRSRWTYPLGVAAILYLWWWVLPSVLL